MNKDKPKNKTLNESIKRIKQDAYKAFTMGKKHFSFGALLIVLLTYVFLVIKIDALSSSEPTIAQTSADTSNTIPKVDSKAVQRIQSLEDQNTQLQSIFNDARNNPFHE